MKRAGIVILIVLFTIPSFSQKAKQNCCSCYNFFSDEEIYFIRDSMISYRFDHETAVWLETNFYEYLYDENYKIKEHRIYVIPPDELIRTPLNRYEYEYHRDEMVMTRFGYSWDENWNSWIESTLARYNFDSTFAVSKRLELTWNQPSEDWIYNYNSQFNKDSKGQHYDSRRTKWDPVKQVWTNDGKTNCSFTPSYDQKTCFSYTWSIDLNEWLPSQRIIDNYDKEGTLQNRVMDVWDQEKLSWKPLRNFYYFYDQYGREIEWLSFGWDDVTGERIGRGRQLYTYDENGNKRETLRYGWDRDSGDWIIYGKQIEYWTDLIKSNRAEISNHEYTIYPNPFQEYTTIEIGDYQNTQRIELVDMFGRKVRILDQINGPTLTLQRGNLKSGLYLLKIVTATDTITLRVIIQ